MTRPQIHLPDDVYARLPKVCDVRAALAMIAQGVTEFATANVKDYEGFGFRKVWNPIASQAYELGCGTEADRGGAQAGRAGVVEKAEGA